MVRAIEDIYSALQRHFGPSDQFNPLPLVRVFGAWMLPNAPRGSVYWSIEWYIQRSLDPAGQHLLGSRYLSAVSMEPWQHSEPHFDLTLTDLPLVDDLGPEEKEETLGVSLPGVVSLISSHPLHTIDNPGLRKMALKHIVAHYFGRMADIPRFGRHSNVEEHDDILYCRGVCAMRYIPSAEQALAYALEQSSEGQLFCPACRRDLIAQLAGFHFGVN